MWKEGQCGTSVCVCMCVCVWKGREGKYRITQSPLHILFFSSPWQGFQMIMLGGRRGVGGAGGSELGGGDGAGYSGVGSFIRNRSRTHHHNTVTQEYRLSIGRIFHKILLYGSTITVTIYKPR